MDEQVRVTADLWRRLPALCDVMIASTRRHLCDSNMSTVTSQDVAIIFAAELHCIFTSKVGYLFSHRLQYIGYPHKLTTVILPTQ